jgi:hypothetical protein
VGVFVGDFFVWDWIGSRQDYDQKLS